MNQRDHADDPESHRLHQAQPVESGEAVGYFASAALAERAMLELRQAGFDADLRQDIWETMNPRQREVILYTLVGLSAGFIVGGLWAVLWWAATGLFPSGNTLALPMARALAGSLIYLGFTALGGWLGYRYAVTRRQHDSALAGGPGGRRFAVVVPLRDPRRQRAEAVRILRAFGAIMVEEEAA